MPTKHFHGCPECYEKWPCEMECTIEPDLEDAIAYPGMHFGAHCVCNGCLNKNPTKEWWEKYNGFTR